MLDKNSEHIDKLIGCSYMGVKEIPGLMYKAHTYFLEYGLHIFLLVPYVCIKSYFEKLRY